MTVKRRKDNNNKVLKEGEYQRPNGTYEYKWKDRRGNRRSIYAKTLDELRTKKEEVLKDILNGVDINVTNLTVNDLFDRWIQLKKGLKAGTISTYTADYNRYVRKDFGTLHIVDIKRSDVKAFYNKLVDVYGLKVSTTFCINSILYQVFEFAVEDEFIRYNPTDKALKDLRRAHGKDFEKKQAMTLEEQEVFETYVENSRYARWYPVFMFMLYTGMRVSEVVGLTWDDIDFENNVVNVNHIITYYKENGEYKYSVNTPKTKSGYRSIPMLPMVIMALKKEKEWQKELDIKCKESIDGYTDFVFLNRFGLTHTTAGLDKVLYRIVRDYNKKELSYNKQKPVLLPHVSNHILRHTFTTRMCEANINLKAMQDILGHADAVTTLQIYADATKELKTAELINFENYFQNIKNRQDKIV